MRIFVQLITMISQSIVKFKQGTDNELFIFIKRLLISLNRKRISIYSLSKIGYVILFKITTSSLKTRHVIKTSQCGKI